MKKLTSRIESEAEAKASSMITDTRLEDIQYGIIYPFLELECLEEKIYFDYLEKNLEELFVKALIYLKLPLNTLKCCKPHEYKSSNNMGIYCSIDNKITIHMHKEGNTLNYHNKKEGMNNKDIDVFVLFHEIGHYYHNYWHNSHFKMYRKRYKHISSFPGGGTEEYNKQCLEKHANNIAKVLYNKLYKRY